MAEQEVKAIFSADTSGVTSGAKQAASAVKGYTDSIRQGMGNADKPTQTLGGSIKNIAVGVGAVAAVTAAIGVLKGSIGSAVGRFDTLNAYPKVMKQMGFSTMDTNKSVGILKKGVDGLPTSLQEITKSSQSFAILTKSATTGAKTATALNDAFLASGASAGDASRGVQQYSQMLASGKVDLMSWRTLQETMPYALTKVANSFGLTGKSAERDLYAKLQSGEITVDQLNQKFMELDGGVNGFANTARTATGGIGTSFTNMKNAVTNGLANTITAIDNGLKNAGVKNGIAGLFNQAKDVIVTSFAAINSVITQAIPPIISTLKTVFDFVKNNKGWLIPLTEGIAGAVATWMTLEKIVSVGKRINKMLGTLKSAFNFGKSLVEFGLKMFGVSAGNTAVAASSAAAATGEKAVGSAAKSSAKSMVEMGLAILEIGAGIGLATAGMALLVLSITQLAKTGTDGVIALAAVTVAIAALVAVFALAGPALTAGAVGIGVFGAAVGAIGIGIGAATAGTAAMINAFVNLTSVTDKIVPTFQQMAIGIVAFVETVLANVPMMAAMFATAMVAIVASVTGAIPQVVTLFLNMITGILASLTENIPTIVSQFTDMILSVFNAIGDNAPRIVAGFAAMLGQLGEAIIEITPYVFQLAGALMAGMIAVIASFSQTFQSIGGVILKSLIAGITGKKYDAMSAATDILNSSGKSASQAGMAAFDAAGGSSAVSALKAISNKKGDANGAGSDLGQSAADGVSSQTGNASDAGISVANATQSGVQGVSLFGAGQGIMQGFLSGLQSMWGSITSFVGGIAGWIKDHKGPISYDKRLLIPAGKAIMGGFNSSLQSSFEDVKNTVNGVAPYIAGAISGQGDYMINTRLSDNMQLDNGSLSVDMNNNVQPAIINLNMGGSDWRAHVNDISNTQGNSARLSRNNSVYL